MPRIAANLTMLFTEASALARPALAQAAGFDGAEILFPYDHPAAEYASALNGLPLALINTPPGDWVSGERGFAAVPGAQTTFREGFLRAADLASRLGAQRLHIMAGVARGLVAEQTYAENLAFAAATAPDLALCIEPLNTLDMPGYFLNDFDQAARLLSDLALPNLGLQFDLWHAARIHGDALEVWHRHAPLVTHIQIAGLKTRSEPGGGGFDLIGFCDALDTSAYQGWVAAEYRPAAHTGLGLGWLTALKSRSTPIGQD